MTGQRINPISYDMLNGNSGSYNYWDEKYNGIGNIYQDNAPLTGGLGDLTDGVIASQNWNIVEAPSGNGPYVGWSKINPTITFNFDGVVNIDTVSIYVDDSNGGGNVNVPSSIGMRMGGSTFSSGALLDPPESIPVSYTFSDLNFQGESLELNLIRRNDWVMPSEVVFFGSKTDEPVVKVNISPTSVSEDGSTNLIYTFTRSGDISTPLNNVKFSVSGSATFDSDYTQSGATSFNSSSGTLKFDANQSTNTITINPTPDTVVEPNETLILTLVPDTGYTVASPSSATGTILDDDKATVSVTVSPTSVSEDGNSKLVYTFTPTGNITTALNNVKFNVSGSATFSNDYTQSGATSFNATTGILNFGANQATKKITIDPKADTTVEPNETLKLTLVNGSNYQALNPTNATGTITNDDYTVSVTVSPTRVNEDGSSNLTYTFKRTGDTSKALNNVKFNVTGTATFNNDYLQSGAKSFNNSTGILNFSANQATKKITINPKSDSVVEANETLKLTLVNGTGYKVVSPTNATGTIVNDDINSNSQKMVALINPEIGSIF